MGIVSSYSVVCAICASFFLDRVMANWRPRWAAARKGDHVVPAASVQANSPRHRIHWIDGMEFAHLIHSDPDLVIFRVIDGFSPENVQMRAPGVVPVTLEQLEDTLPWIPLGSRMAIYRAGGIDAALARRLATILHGREALLLREDAARVAENLNESVGETCH